MCRHAHSSLDLASLGGVIVGNSMNYRTSINRLRNSDVTGLADAS